MFAHWLTPLKRHFQTVPAANRSFTTGLTESGSEPEASEVGSGLTGVWPWSPSQLREAKLGGCCIVEERDLRCWQLGSWWGINPVIAVCLYLQPPVLQYCVCTLMSSIVCGYVPLWIGTLYATLRISIERILPVHFVLLLFDACIHWCLPWRRRLLRKQAIS